MGKTSIAPGVHDEAVESLITALELMGLEEDVELSIPVCRSYRL